MIKEITSFLGRDKMIPEYQQRADRLRQMAINQSLAEGVFFDKTKGVDLVEGQTSSAIVRFGDKKVVEFAINSDRIAFARIENGKYYPLKTKLPEEFIKLSNRYEDLVGSKFKRFFTAVTGRELTDRSYFNMFMVLGEIGDSVMLIRLSLESSKNQIKEILDEQCYGEKSLVSLVELEGKMGELNETQNERKRSEKEILLLLEQVEKSKKEDKNSTI